MRRSQMKIYFVGNIKITWLIVSNKKPTNWWGRQIAAPLKFDSKLSDATFSKVFLG